MAALKLVRVKTCNIYLSEPAEKSPFTDYFLILQFVYKP